MLSRPKRGSIKFAGAVLCTMSSTADCALSVIGSPTCRCQECCRKSSDAQIAANQSGWRKSGLPNGLKSVVSAQNATSAFRSYFLRTVTYWTTGQHQKPAAPVKVYVLMNSPSPETLPPAVAGIFLGDAKDGFHRKILGLLARSWRQVI